jgi:hypothetical protein
MHNLMGFISHTSVRYIFVVGYDYYMFRQGRSFRRFFSFNWKGVRIGGLMFIINAKQNSNWSNSLQNELNE